MDVNRVVGVRISSCPLMRNIMFKSSWSDYEEHNSVIIWEQNGCYFMERKGHNVFCGDYHSKRKISEKEAFEIMFENIENEDDEYLGRI